MTHVYDVVLPDRVTSATTIGQATLRLTAEVSGRVPATVVLSLGDWRAVEHSFADLRYDPSVGALVPVIDLAEVGEGGKTRCIVVCGLRKWWIVSDAGPSSSLVLNRREDDDRGFYNVDVVDTEYGSLFIYEGGLVMVAASGRIVWHVTKSWNEAVRSVSADIVELVDEGDRSRRVQLRTGDECI